MKIGFFTDSYLPQHHGVVSSIESFQRALKKRGHEVFIYAPESPGYIDPPNVFRLKSVRVIKKPEMRLALPVAMPGRIKELLGLKLDVVHAHTIFTLGLVAKIISKHQGIPIVYTHHTDYAEYAKIYLKEGYISPFIASRLTSSFSNYTDGVIAPSAKVEKYLRSIGVEKPITILPTGVNMEEFKKTDSSKEKANQIRKKMGISDTDKVIMYLGRVCAEKNISFLIESLVFIEKSVPGTKLIIVGDGPDLERLKNIAKDLKIEENVIFAGFIPKELKTAHYSMADLFVFASKTDTQGIVILEAMASGLPIVAVNDEAISSMVKNGQNGYLVKEDPEEFAKKTIELLKNADLMGKMSKKSSLLCRDFSEESETDKLLAIYESVISSKVYGKTK